MFQRFWVWFCLLLSFFFPLHSFFFFLLIFHSLFLCLFLSDYKREWAYVAGNGKPSQLILKVIFCSPDTEVWSFSSHFLSHALTTEVCLFLPLCVCVSACAHACVYLLAHLLTCYGGAYTCFCIFMIQYFVFFFKCCRLSFAIRDVEVLTTEVRLHDASCNWTWEVCLSIC